MGTLPRELCQCAADAEVACCVGAATHVPRAGLDVSFGVYQAGAGAPGLGPQHLLTGGFLVRGNTRRVAETEGFFFLEMSVFN